MVFLILPDNEFRFVSITLLIGSEWNFFFLIFFRSFGITKQCLNNFIGDKTVFVILI